METNSLDKEIKKQLENRVFTPSDSAWERLSEQLDNSQPKKNYNKTYLSIAASILILIFIGIELVKKSNTDIPLIEEVVINPIEKDKVKNRVDEIFNNEETKIEVVDNKRVLESKEKNKINSIILSDSIKLSNKVDVVDKNKSKEIKVAKSQQKDIKKSINNNQSLDTSKREIKSNNAIKVNPDDLLYAVTHSPEEVKAYYAKYQTTREDVLKTIKTELEKSKININPETILAEVERSIDDEAFQNNFLKTLKSKISNIATAIASRNN